MNPDWLLLTLSAVSLLFAANAYRQQGTFGKVRRGLASARAKFKVRWRLATMSSNEAGMLYLLADEAWMECDQTTAPRIGSGVRSPIEKYHYTVSRNPEIVDEAIEKLRAVSA